MFFGNLFETVDLLTSTALNNSIKQRFENKLKKLYIIKDIVKVTDITVDILRHLKTRIGILSQTPS